MHEQCFVIVEGNTRRVEVDEEGESGDYQWCFACACQGCAKPLGDTDTQQCMRCKCYVHVTCINDGACLSCVEPAPEQGPEPRRELRAFHTSWQSGRLWLKYEDAMMHSAACRTYPQLGAQPDWISGLKNCTWDKIKKHQQLGCHAVSLALWNSAGKVRKVTHTLPLELEPQAIRALFRVVYGAVKRRGMLGDVAGDTEAGELNGAMMPAACAIAGNLPQLQP